MCVETLVLVYFKIYMCGIPPECMNPLQNHFFFLPKHDAMLYSQLYSVRVGAGSVL